MSPFFSKVFSGAKKGFALLEILLIVAMISTMAGIATVAVKNPDNQLAAIFSRGTYISPTVKTTASTTPPLMGTCFGSVSGNMITWSASAFGAGGVGTYTYTWTGGVTGSGSPITKTYTYIPGGNNTKIANLTIRSGTSSFPTSCSATISGTTPPSVCTYTCTAWGSCSAAGLQDCTSPIPSPTGCTGGTPVPPRACTPVTTPVSGSCTGTPSNTNGEITWRAFPVPTTGSYTYSWTYDVIDTGNPVFKTYDQTNPGLKYVTVRIASGTNSFNASCTATPIFSGTPTCTYTCTAWGSCINGTQTCATPVKTPTGCVGGTPVPPRACTSPIEGSCTASPSVASSNEIVTWSVVSPSGGNGPGSYTYLWSGAVTGTSMVTSRAYSVSTTTTMNADVTITSGGTSIIRRCSVKVNPLTYPIYGSCYPNKPTVNSGETVIWTVTSLAGGSGPGSYTFQWTGDDTLTGTNSTTSKTYFASTTDTKNAHIEISSGGNSIIENCSVIVNPLANPIGGSCSPDKSSVSSGEVVTWSVVSPTGGNGPGSYTYVWTGDDSLSGTNSTTSKAYSVSTTTTKNANVTIKSGTLPSVTKSCSVLVYRPEIDCLKTDDLPISDELKKYVSVSESPLFTTKQKTAYMSTVKKMGYNGVVFCLLLDDSSKQQSCDDPKYHIVLNRFSSINTPLCGPMLINGSLYQIFDVSSSTALYDTSNEVNFAYDDTTNRLFVPAITETFSLPSYIPTSVLSAVNTFFKTYVQQEVYKKVNVEISHYNVYSNISEENLQVYNQTWPYLTSGIERSEDFFGCLFSDNFRCLNRIFIIKDDDINGTAILNYYGSKSARNQGPGRSTIFIHSGALDKNDSSTLGRLLMHESSHLADSKANLTKNPKSKTRAFFMKTRLDVGFFGELNESNFIIPGGFGGHSGDNVDELFASAITGIAEDNWSDLVKLKNLQFQRTYLELLTAINTDIKGNTKFKYLPIRTILPDRIKVLQEIIEETLQNMLGDNNQV